MSVENFEYTKDNILGEFVKIKKDLQENGVSQVLIHNAFNFEKNPYISMEGINDSLTIIQTFHQKYSHIFRLLKTLEKNDIPFIPREYPCFLGIANIERDDQLVQLQDALQLTLRDEVRDILKDFCDIQNDNMPLENKI